MGVTGKGEGTSATKGRDSSASRVLRALWITEGEVFAAFVGLGMLESGWLSSLLCVSEAVWLHSLETEAAGFDSDSAFDWARVGRVEADCTGVSVSQPTVSGLLGSLVIGGLGAGFLVLWEGEDDEEDATSGDTGGLPLVCRAASLGECLRFGGIGVADF